MKEGFKISDIEVGGADKVFFIAEVGGNHNGNVELAKRMIDAAYCAGAHAVKFQTYVTENVLSKKSPYFNEFKKEHISFDDFKILSGYATDKGIIFFSTPFDFESVEFLASINVPAFKIASCDINNFPLIRKIAEKKKPILLSTGASAIAEVKKTVNYLREMKVSELALMQCTALYPPEDNEINLNVISAYKEMFEAPVGFSDHSAGTEISLAAIALGACIIEKHFTIDRNLSGGDNGISILPEELKFLVEGSKRIKRALGTKEKTVSASEIKVQCQIRKSPVAKKNIITGEFLTEENIAIKRPAAGLPPEYYFTLKGMRVKSNIDADEPITLEKVEKIV